MKPKAYFTEAYPLAGDKIWTSSFVALLKRNVYAFPVDGETYSQVELYF